MSVPINDYAIANEELANKTMKQYYECCGKSICGGCIYSFHESGNNDKCPFCNSERMGKTDDEKVDELMKRVDVNDAAAMYLLGNDYYHGILGLQQDREKALELYTRAAKLGSSDVHYELGINFHGGGDVKKAKSHYETAAMAGHESARYNLGIMEGKSGNAKRGLKHLRIAASAGDYGAMYALLRAFNQSAVSRESMDSTLTAYNKSCAEMRSKARDSFIRFEMRQTERNNA
jgi:TPR repeat protein